MVYGYTTIDNLMGIVLNDRQAIVIKNVHIKDLSEYIPQALRVMNNLGIDTNMFTQPKVVSNKDSYDIILMVRANHKNVYFTPDILDNLSKTFETKVITLKNYVSSYYRKTKVLKNNNTGGTKYITANAVEALLRNEAKLFIEFKNIKSNSSHLIKGLMQFQLNKQLISKVDVVLEESVDYCDNSGKLHRYTVGVDSLSNDFRKIVALGCSRAYRLCKLNPVRATIVYSDSSTQQYDIHMTSKSLDLVAI